MDANPPQIDAPASQPTGNRQRGNLTTGPVMKTMLAFTAPTLLGNMLQSLNGSVNSIWVGRLIGEDALAATANVNVIVFLVFAAVFGFGMAATVKVAQHFGADNIDAARRTFGSAVGFCFILAIVVSVTGWICAPALLTALHTPGEAWTLALTYLRVIFIALPTSMLSIMLNMGLRGSGDSRTPLIFMVLTVVIDIALNPLLIVGVGPLPKLGIAGAALSTVLAGTIGLGGMVWYIYARNLPLRLRGAELAYLLPRRAEMGYIVTKGLPMGAQMLLVSAAGIILVGLVNREGLLASAAYGATVQIWTYLQMPAMAISAAVSAMAAQAIGAKLPARISAITRAGIIANLAITGALTALIMLFDRQAMTLFLGPDSPAVPLARHIQLLASWGFLLFGITIVLFGTMRAAGVVIAPLIALGLALYPGRLGFVALAYPALGADAVWLSMPVGSVLSVAFAAIAYYLPGWKARMLADMEKPAARGGAMAAA